MGQKIMKVIYFKSMSERYEPATPAAQPSRDNPLNDTPRPILPSLRERKKEIIT